MYPLHTLTVKDQEAAKGTNEVTNEAHFTRKESTASHIWLTLTPKVPSISVFFIWEAQKHHSGFGDDRTRHRTHL